jgi:hypothetical protein
MFCIDESSAVEDGEESLEVAMDKGWSLRTCFLGNDILLCLGQASEQISFNLWSAHLQLRWYGLRLISMSFNDILPLKIHLSIISAAPVAILSSLLHYRIRFVSVGGDEVSSVCDFEFICNICLLSWCFI